jgi:hypothetical protein
MSEDPKTETVKEPEPKEIVETPKAPEKEAKEDDLPEGVKIVLKKLRDENRDLAKRAKKADELEADATKRKEAEMTELEKEKAKVATLESENKATKIKLMQREAAAKIGLPDAFVELLKGETPEDMEAHAKTLLDAMPKAAKGGTPSPTNPGNAATQGETEEQQRARIYGNANNLFDKNYLRSIGGGAVIKEKVG